MPLVATPQIPRGNLVILVSVCFMAGHIQPLKIVFNLPTLLTSLAIIGL